MKTSKTHHEDESFLEAVLTLAREILDREERAQPFSQAQPQDLERELDWQPGESGLDKARVLDRLSWVMSHSPSSSHPHFVNQLFGGREDISLMAEMLAVVNNNSLYTFKAAGAQVLVENAVLDKMLAAAGMPGGEGIFVPGGSMANLSALVLARAKAFPQAREEGMQGPRATIYTSAEGHYSIPKNAGILGLGRKQVRFIPVDGQGRMDMDQLESTIARDRAAGFQPFFLNGTAGTTVRGAFDPLDDMAALARKEGLWFHVDGALGGSLLLHREHRELLAGVEEADSLAWNPHKLMGVALQTSVILTRHRGSLAGSFDETADYLFQAHDQAYNPGHRSPQCGRRNDALRLWAAWMLLGDEGWHQRLETQMKLARTAAQLVREHPRLELLEEPQSINVCFQVKGRSSEEVCAALDASGRLKIGHGDVAGRRAIRLVCVNPELEEAQLRTILDMIGSA